MGELHGPYPMLDSFAPGAMSHQTLESPQHNTTGVKLRRHAACDECRKRKLKCTGEPTGCTRCVKNAIPCIYSQQKQMGRPRKRQKTDDGSESPVAEETQEVQFAFPPPSLPEQVQMLQVESSVVPQLETPIDPSLANIDQELTDFQNVCNGPMAQTIRDQREAEILKTASESIDLHLFEHNGDATSLDYPYTRYPTDISLWPDFSAIDKLPLPITSRFDPDPANDLPFSTPSADSITNTDMMSSQFDPDVDPAALTMLPAVPACPCLPNLYLSLSTLSTLSSFPTSQDTINTLMSAHKTAHSVIYCPVCPQSFQAGSQNLMLGCTLLNVIADHWLKIRNATSDALRKGFSSPQFNYRTPTVNNSSSSNNNNNNSHITVKEGHAWRNFARQLVRAYVFGDASIPKPPSTTTTTTTTTTSPFESSTTTATAGTTKDDNPKIELSNTLKFLTSALERRQRQWHRLDPLTDEFPDRFTNDYPLTIVQYAGKIEDPDKTRLKNTADGDGDGDESSEENGVRSGGEEDGNGNKRKRKHKDRHGHDHAHNPYLCLMIVKHSKDFVAALERDS